MIIVKPKIISPYIDGKAIMKNIEKAGRTCYKSEVKDENSYKNFIKNCINRGHESVIEHEKISVRLITDRGTMWDITRHRHCSFSIESSRYCNYSKDKFGNQIKVIEPFFLKPDIQNENSEEWQKYKSWVTAMEQSEKSYFDIINNGGTPDQARMVLPASLATEICMTANIREWRHIFSLRCQSTVHPHVRQVMIPLLLYFKEKMPELFDDIPYDEEFANKYQNDLAKIEVEFNDIQQFVISQYCNIMGKDVYDDDANFEKYENEDIKGKIEILSKLMDLVFVDSIEYTKNGENKS